MQKTYEQLMEEVRLLQTRGILPTRPTLEQRIDWAYGQTKIEDDAVTMQDAVDGVTMNEGR